MRISKSRLQFIASLRQKKQRREHGLFTAEGSKCVIDTIDAFELHTLVATDEWVEAHSDVAKSVDGLLFTASHAEMQRLSQLSSTPDVAAVYHVSRPCGDEWFDGIDNRLTLVLDGVQDPGNLGTIIRTADWFGIHHILASPATADLYNLKTVQSTMGAISRVKMLYAEVVPVVRRFPSLPVYGTQLDGDDIYNARLGRCGFIVMGNEGQGITPSVREIVTHGLRIPSYPAGAVASESLNVASATAITIAEFRRRMNHNI